MGSGMLCPATRKKWIAKLSSFSMLAEVGREVVLWVDSVSGGMHFSHGRPLLGRRQFHVDELSLVPLVHV